MERIRLVIWLVSLGGLAWLTCLGADEAPSPTTVNHRGTVLVVAGAPGEQVYGEAFQQWSSRILQTAKAQSYRVLQFGADTTDVGARDAVLSALAAEATPQGAPLWFFYFGHGTFDGDDARLNLTGPDLTAAELAQALKRIPRPQILVFAASASTHFLQLLSATNRVVVCATRSGFEDNYARFGEFFSGALTGSAGDLDKDGQSSVLEAFLLASRQVAEFYRTQGRMLTEHALLDDNGDGKGTPADRYQGVRAAPGKTGDAPADGAFAHQFHLVSVDRDAPGDTERRRQLEGAIAGLRDQKPSMSEAEYYRRLEALCLDLARLASPRQP